MLSKKFYSLLSSALLSIFSLFLVSQSVSAGSVIPSALYPAFQKMSNSSFSDSYYIMGLNTTNNEPFAYFFVGSVWSGCLSSNPDNPNVVVKNCSTDSNAMGDYSFLNNSVVWGSSTLLLGEHVLSSSSGDIEIYYTNIPDFITSNDVECPECTVESVIADKISTAVLILAATIIVMSFFKVILNMYMGVRR